MPDQPTLPPPPKPKKRLLRRLFRWAFRLALLAVVLLVLAAVGVKLYFTPARTGQVVSRVAKSVLKQDVTIGSIAIKPLSGIEVTQVVIPDPTRRDGPPIFKLGRFTLDYSLKPLWNRLLKVNKIQIVDPELNVASEGGKWNFLALLPPKSPAPPPPPKKPGPARPLSLPVGVE
ncbi:MAG: hypothetical protein FJ278_24125, partial [Planctomycetes bacterium]|nr:hypothetical protein [Planctomycetota bacterium]